VIDHLWWQPVAAWVIGLAMMTTGGLLPWGVRLTNGETSLRQRTVLAVAGTAAFAFSVVSLISGSVSPFLYFRF